MNPLGWAVGAAMTLRVVWGSARLDPRAAVLPAVLGWLTVLLGAGLTLPSLLREGWPGCCCPSPANAGGGVGRWVWVC